MRAEWTNFLHNSFLWSHFCKGKRYFKYLKVLHQKWLIIFRWVPTDRGCHQRHFPDPAVSPGWRQDLSSCQCWFQKLKGWPNCQTHPGLHYPIAGKFFGKSLHEKKDIIIIILGAQAPLRYHSSKAEFWIWNSRWWRCFYECEYSDWGSIWLVLRIIKLYLY